MFFYNDERMVKYGPRAGMDGSWSEDAFHTSVLMPVPHTQGTQPRVERHKSETMVSLLWAPFALPRTKFHLGLGKFVNNAGNLRISQYWLGWQLTVGD